MENNKKKSALFVVSTPIGNLKDITLRALETLKSVDLIAAEDTRITRRLLSAYQITGSLVSYREQNREKAARSIMDALGEGRRVALVTDAGTPGISDPGAHLISLCIREGIDVVQIPGASSILCALSISGLDTSQFVFLGFLPRKGKKRRIVLLDIGRETKTVVIFESPQRVRETLVDILDCAGDRRCALCREMTKVHEEVIRGKVSEVLTEIDRRPNLRGEVVIVLAGREREDETGIDLETVRREVARYRAGHPEKKTREAAEAISVLLGIPTKVAYTEIIKYKK